jgi:spore coat protein SA
MTKVIYNGINHDQFSPLWQNDDKRMKLRREAGILDDEILLLYVGQIRADKGVLSVVKAFETLLGSHSNIKLMIIGSASGGNDNPNNRQQKFFDEFNLHIKQLPSKKVIQQGFISRKEIQNIFLMGDIFCAPSIVTETFGLVIAEAMATGLPIITSNKGGIPEVIGDTGFVTTRPEEPDDIIMYANQLIADKKLRLDCGKKAFNRIIENFTWEITAQRTEEIYDQLLK